MSRRRLGLGQHGDIDAVPQRRDATGKWKTLQNNRRRTAERWRARAAYRGHDGILAEVSRFAPTKPQAIAALETAIRERIADASQEMSASTPLVDAGHAWLAQVSRKESGLSEASIRTYRQTFDRHIGARGSSIRGLSLAQANSPQRLRAFLQAVADSSGTATAKTVKSVLSGILALAIDNGALDTNALRSIRPVKSETPHRSKRDHSRALTAVERGALIDYADKLAVQESIDPRSMRKREASADLVAFMMGTGARIGEARGLRWEHMDLAGGFVRLHGTKSRSARRRVDLPQWLLERMTARTKRMREHYAHAAKHAKKSANASRAQNVAAMSLLAETAGTVGFVFASPAHLDPERPWDQSNSSNAARALLDGAGLSWAIPHTFRRTVATRLGEAGAPLAQIADQLGHADPSMTASVYLGRDFDGDKSALAALL